MACKYELRGSIITTNFAHQAYVGGQDGNLTRTARMKLGLLRSAKDAEGNEFRIPITVPYISGNSLRGRIRRAVLGAIKAHLRARGDQLDVATMRSMTNGSAAWGKMDKAAIDVAVFNGFASHTFWGVFGFETAYASQIMTPDVIPITEDTIACGLVPRRAVPESRVHPSGQNLVATFDRSRRDDFLEMLDTDAPNIVRDYADQYERLQKLVLTERSERKSQKDAPQQESVAQKKRADLRMIFSYEAIVPGTNMWWKLGVGNDPSRQHFVTPAHVGVLLLGMERIISGSVLGGLRRFGYGTCDGNFDLYCDGQNLGIALRVEDGEAQIARENEHVSQAVESAEWAIEQMTAAEFDALYSDHGQVEE